MTIAPTCFGFG